MRMRWAERIKQHGLTQKLEASATEKVAAKGKTVKLGIKPTQLSGNETVILDSVTKRYGHAHAVRERNGSDPAR